MSTPQTPSGSASALQPTCKYLGTKLETILRAHDVGDCCIKSVLIPNLVSHVTKFLKDNKLIAKDYVFNVPMMNTEKIQYVV